MISAVPAFADNYIWIIHGDHSGGAAVVDPGDAAPVIRFLNEHHVHLTAILITHHHADHVGGIDDLLHDAAQRNGLDNMPRVFGPANEAIAAVTVPLRDGDVVDLEELGMQLTVMDVPGHTAGHIAYVGTTPGAAPCVFCGDTLFAAGCGRLFEGSAEQMWSSLSKLAALPQDTRVYCAHEYTLSNLRFAVHAMPQDAAIAQRLRDVSALREQGRMTVPSTIGMELHTNPFLLCRNVQDFAAMRKNKDGFRG